MTERNTSFLHIHENDNVLVALTDLKVGNKIDFQGKVLDLKDSIPAKHKFFIHDIKEGEEVFMYGVVVGKVTKTLSSGMLMTTENTVHAAEPYAYRATNYIWKAPDVSAFKDKTFMGYHRTDGKVGTANYWLFIPTVFCENRNLEVIKEALHHSLGYVVTGKYLQFAKLLAQSIEKQEDISNIDFQVSDPVSKRVFKNIDGIKFLNHQGGCGGTRQDSDSLSMLLAAYADHPNVAGITLLSLGCQHLQLAQLQKDIKLRNPNFNKPIFAFEQQQSKSEESLIREAILQTFIGLKEANKIQRAAAPLSKLVLGVKCGGSDGFSGISANPAVGVTADLLVALGGTVLLAEFPELCGAEQDLIDRCVSAANAKKFIHLMQTYDAQAHAAGSGFHMNPSPGNIKDGLITDAIKSTGAAKKGGNSPVTDVLDYTEPATKPGLNLVCTPGNDVEATTGKAAAGATLILFTTGLGTPTGNPVCPVIKVATNTALAKRMSDIIDIDTGSIIRGEKTVSEMGLKFWNFVLM
jgi:altronate hydrolase